MTEAQQNVHSYRPINMDFLHNNETLAFDIYYKVKSIGEASFEKFASATDPRHREKVRKLLESGDFRREFYVHENDLFKYYSNATQSLRAFIKNDKISLREKTKKIYSVSRDIMKEFFEYNATDKVLRCSEQVMGIMEECLSTNQMGFNALVQITNKDYYTYTHSVNVGLYCMTYGIKAKWPPGDIKDLGLGGMMHDVGKAKIPREIINKDGQLTDAEFEVMKNHPQKGEEMLSLMSCYGKNVLHMTAQHHEKWRGGGYPKKLDGEVISPFARICKIMDVYDALSTHRSYKKAMQAFDALTMMKRKMADQFDPKLLDSFIRLMGPDM